jgi:hypothetical protein
MATQVGDILRIALSWLVDGSEQMVNVHTFEVDDLGGLTDDADIMADLAGSALLDLYTPLLSFVANNVVGDVITAINLTRNTVMPPVAWNADGANTAADALARQLTGLVYLNTVVPRRQGRCYLPPFGEGDVMDTGLWNTLTVAAMAGFGVDLLGTLVGDSVDIHRVVGHSIPTGFSVPTFAGVSLAPRTQRRRTPGRGA